MKPTITDVCEYARQKIGDDAQPGGEIFTNKVLLPFIGEAIREMFRCLRGALEPFTLREGFYVLPPYTSVLDPATAGLTNFAEPEFVEWRSCSDPIAITNVVVGLDGSGNPIATVTTATPHGLTTGTNIDTYGIQGFSDFNSPNGHWTITVTDSTNFTLNGCTATGTYDSGGFVINGGVGQFVAMDPKDRQEIIPATQAAPGQSGQLYAWQGDVFQFTASTGARELRIVYRASGNPDMTDLTAVIPIDDCKDFIATRAVGMAASAKSAQAAADRLTAQALGPRLEADGSGGILGQLLRSDIRNMQRIQYRYQGFRARRNRPDFMMF